MNNRFKEEIKINGQVFILGEDKTKKYKYVYANYNFLGYADIFSINENNLEKLDVCCSGRHYSNTVKKRLYNNLIKLNKININYILLNDLSNVEKKIIYVALKEYEDKHYAERSFLWQEVVNKLIKKFENLENIYKKYEEE